MTKRAVRARRRQLWAASFGMWLLLAAAVGCGKKQPAQTPPKAPPKPAVLIGSVRMAAGHDLPAYSPDEMERQVLAHVKGGSFPSMCSPARKEDRMPVSMTSDGKLIGVMVAASEFSHQPPPGPPRLHPVTIKDCRLTPPLVVARIGDILQVKNEVDFPFLPGMGTDVFSQTLTPGQTREVPLDTGGVRILSCGFTAPCGRTDVIVMAHPYFAITDDKGEFRIEDFPADETVRLNAWHPLFHEAFIDVRVERGETKEVQLELSPKEAPVALPPPAKAAEPEATKGKAKQKPPKVIVPD